MIVESSKSGVRSWRVPLTGTVGLVPTMGYLHAGHISLVEAARTENDHVAASIFVNPTQFGPREDLSTYPRDLRRDLELLEAAGVDLVFAPEANEVYPPGFDTYVVPGAIAERLEGSSRPGHFRGVTTVVLKLFNILQPHSAYFGQKDAQQLRVIRKMVSDLDLPVQICGLPTIREADGLAMSSRNAYLNPEERQAALALHWALDAAVELWRSGTDDASELRRAVESLFAQEPCAALDYVSVADGITLQELERVAPDAVVSLAARVGKTRLIDNVVLEAVPAAIRPSA